MEQKEAQAHEAAERAARESFGRLVAFLSARTGDIAAAEDALADALLRALQVWPIQGVPDNPEAWLMVAAKRRRFDGLKHETVVERAGAELARTAQEMQSLAENKFTFPDHRLRLLFVCAHPAIDVTSHAPLMLQTVLGLDAARIAKAFAMEPAAMGQRLVRTKRKIAAAKIPFVIPDPEMLRPRLGAVLDAIYAAYGTGWDESGTGQSEGDLAAEARYLAAVVEAMCRKEGEGQQTGDEHTGDQHPECLGLVALMDFCEARRQARRNAHGAYVPLGEQDPKLWNLPLLASGEARLKQAAAGNRPGRFQLEAAIQSAISVRAFGRKVDWHAVALLYEGLVRLWPSTGAMVGRAVVVAELLGAESGLRALSEVLPAQAACYQPFWAAKAELLSQLGDAAAARAAYARAIAMSGDAAVSAWLAGRSAAL